MNHIAFLMLQQFTLPLLSKWNHSKRKNSEYAKTAKKYAKISSIEEEEFFRVNFFCNLLTFISISLFGIPFVFKIDLEKIMYFWNL